MKKSSLSLFIADESEVAASLIQRLLNSQRLSFSFLSFLILLPEGTCVSVCPAGSYGDDDTNDCEECHPSCQTCRGPDEDDCLSCEGGGTLSGGGGECLSEHEVCPVRTFRSGETSLRVCIPLIHLSAYNERGIWAPCQGQREILEGNWFLVPPWAELSAGDGQRDRTPSRYGL